MIDKFRNGGHPHFGSESSMGVIEPPAELFKSLTIDQHQPRCEFSMAGQRGAFT